MSTADRESNLKTFEESRYRLVKVVWIDIVASAGWSPEGNSIAPPHRCETYGFITAVERDEDLGDYITVSASLGINGSKEYNQHITIPIGCIRSFEHMT